ncbi:MAG: C13 family peptidase [Nannocystaceae bacterium]|nr:C13 family peptidase [Nannocystaceae bacterium]
MHALRRRQRLAPGGWRLLLAALCLMGCRAATAPQPPWAAIEPSSYAAGPTSPTTKVFLIAGGNDVANFAAEVLEQRTLWRKAGLREDQIACYWARPSADDFQSDRAQFEALALALRSCHIATPGRVANDLRIAAQHAEGFVFVYVTSHGLASQLRPLESSKQPRTGRLVASLSPAERNVLDPAAIGLLAGEGPRLGDPRAIVTQLRRGSEPAAVVFTPRTLGPLLAAFPADVRKIIVLQACFSGAFIDHHDTQEAEPSAGADALLRVPNLTALTATAAERPSFGCGSGEARTYFGGTFNVALSRALEQHAPGELPWQDIYDNVVFAIEAMESVQGVRSSRPGFVQTTPAP